MDIFIRVDIQEYVKEGLDSGILIPFQAKKTGMIHAVQGKLNQEVISWVENPDGSARIERVGTVQVDDTTKGLGWVVTKVDENGQPIIDKNNHLNQWIIKDSVFKNTYEKVSSKSELYAKKDIQILVQIPNSIIFTDKYGEEMNVGAAGYINITNPTKMYGISERDFNDTYTLINHKVAKRKA